MTILEYLDKLYPSTIATVEKKKLKDALHSKYLFQNFSVMPQNERAVLLEWLQKNMPRIIESFLKSEG